MKKIVVFLIGIISYNDCIAQQPRLVKDINTKSTGSNPQNFMNSNSILFFSTDDSINGTE